MEIPEQRWLHAAHQMDEQTLAAIYDCFSPGLYRYAYRLLGDAALAEDCVAETFSRFLHALHAGGGPQTHLQAYLYRVAHNWMMDFYRRQPPPPFNLDELPQHSSNNAEQVSTEHAAEQSIRKDQLRAALRRLTADQRQVVTLKYLEGLQNDEIADILGKPVGAVKALQHRAEAALRRLLIKVEA
jgi:RNA polymerase sigma-70 factor (ECF subfamily)